MNFPEEPKLSHEAPESAPPSNALFREARHAYSSSMLFLGLYGVISVCFTLFVSIVCALLKLEVSDTIAYFISFGSMYAVAFPLFLLMNRSLPTYQPKSHNMTVGQIILAFFMAEGLAICGNIFSIMINGILSMFFGFDGSTDMLENGFGGDSAWIFSIFGVLIAPIIEEWMFRKTLIDRVRKYGDGVAILLSGVLFGLFHGNLSQFFYAAALGIFFAFIYIRTGKIRYTIILHMSINFLGGVIATLATSHIDMDAFMDAAENNDIPALLSMMNTLLPLLFYSLFTYAAAITGVILLICFRKKFQIAPPAVSLPRRTQAKAVFLNLGFWVFFLYCLADFVVLMVENAQSAIT